MGGAKATFEAVRPATEVGALWDHGHLVLVVGDDFGKFVLDVF